MHENFEQQSILYCLYQHINFLLLPATPPGGPGLRQISVVYVLTSDSHSLSSFRKKHTVAQFSSFSILEIKSLCLSAAMIVDVSATKQNLRVRIVAKLNCDGIISHNR